MKILLPFFIAGFMVVSFFPFSSLGQDIHFDSVQRTQDEINSNILSMAQDSRGFLWLGTVTGLFKYDGFQYTAYHNQPANPNSMSSDEVECLATDKQGYIWMGHFHNTSGLDRLDPSTGIFTHFHHMNNDVFSLSSDTTTAIMQDHEGTIWVGTMKGLDRYDSKTNRFYHYQHNENDPASLSSNQVRTIYEDKQGTLWVGTGSPFLEENRRKEGGLNKLDKKTGKFTSYLHHEKDPHSLVDDRIRARYEDNHGNFWVGSAGDGLHKMDRSTGSFERLMYDSLHPDGLSRPPVQKTYNYATDHITFITEDIKGRLWIGTFQGGINVYDPSTKKSTWYGSGKNSKEILHDNAFWAACKTKDGLIWISTWGSESLYKINPHYQNKAHYTHTGAAVLAFAEDNAQTLWLATSKGLIHRDLNGMSHQFLVDKDSTSGKNFIYYVEKDENNRLWLATSHGLYYFDPVSNTIIPYKPGIGSTTGLIADTVIFVISKSKNDKLWIGTAVNGLKLLDIKTGEVITYNHSPEDSNSLSSDNVRAITTDKNGNLWVATRDGLNMIDKQTGHFKKYLNKVAVDCVMEDSEDNLWAGTEQGFFRFDRNTNIFLPFADQSGIFKTSTGTWGIAEDHNQYLWLNTSKGILRLNKERNEILVFGKNQGVNPIVTQNFGYTQQNGDVLFGVTEGYFTFSSAHMQEDTSRPIANISSFLLNDIAAEPSPNSILSAPLEQTEEIRLNHNQNTFSFGFSSVNFISKHEDTRLLYMLQNYDNDWRLSNENREAYYFNLPPGRYVFRVKVYGASGRSDEKQIAIIITPPWWRTWWAYSFYGLFLLTGIFFTDRIRRKVVIERERAKTKERELAQAKEIEKAYKQLETAHENLKSTQSQLIQSEKMASLGELTAGIAHEIQNPLNFVNNFSEVNNELIYEMQNELKSGNADEAIAISNNIKGNQDKIIYHGKRADAIVKGMLQHTRNTNNIKESTDINALADEYLRLAYHGLRAKNNSFNATMKTDFDESIGKINIIPQDIGRVLLNLYNNAFYAVGEKKKSAEAGYDPTVSVITKKVDNKITISVKDTGSGIPQKVVDKIFQPFFTTKPAGQGTGLGLSLSYDIVKAHGGELKVETREGDGTTFIIVLPIINFS
jgi:ligand-binding sensor domain-containing protein/signal transduction histidine kinase